MKPMMQRKEGKGDLLLVSSFRSKHTSGPSRVCSPVTNRHGYLWALRESTW